MYPGLGAEVRGVKAADPDVFGHVLAVLGQIKVLVERLETIRSYSSRSRTAHWSRALWVIEPEGVCAKDMDRGRIERRWRRRRARRFAKRHHSLRPAHAISRKHCR